MEIDGNNHKKHNWIGILNVSGPRRTDDLRQGLTKSQKEECAQDSVAAETNSRACRQRERTLPGVRWAPLTESLKGSLTESLKGR